MGTKIQCRSSYAPFRRHGHGDTLGRRITREIGLILIDFGSPQTGIT